MITTTCRIFRRACLRRCFSPVAARAGAGSGARAQTTAPAATTPGPGDGVGYGVGVDMYGYFGRDAPRGSRSRRRNRSTRRHAVFLPERRNSTMRAFSAAVATLPLLACFVPRPADATQKYGPIQLSGNLQTANIVRTPDVQTYEYIMNRNITHIRLDYDWLQAGEFYSKYEIPFIESSHLSVLWRGVYDSVYDTTPGFFMKEDIHGKAYAGNLTLDQYRRVKGFPSSVLKLDGLTSEERT